MARTRTYKLPNGEKTTREGSFRKQWTDFLKPVAKALHLTINTFNSQEAELFYMYRKGNGKRVPKYRVTLPHWLVWGIQICFHRYEQRIAALLKANAALRAENKAYQQFFHQMQEEQQPQAPVQAQGNADPDAF